MRARGPIVAGLTAVLAAKWAKIPSVVSLGGDYRLCFDLQKHYPILNSRSATHWVEEFAYKNSDRIFCINRFCQRYVSNLGADPASTRHIPLRIDLDTFKSTLEPSEAKKKVSLGQSPTVVFIGRLELDKQVETTLESIPSILRAVPDAQFVFVGDGSLRDSLVARAEALGIASRITITGFQSADKVALYLAAADVVWIPMAGFVIFEASACKKPIVAYDVDWHSEFIINDRTGLLVENRNSSALASAVSRVLLDKDLAKRLGHNAYDKLMTEYDLTTLATTEVEAYRELLDSYRR